jgi:hypothetical protein
MTVIFSNFGFATSVFPTVAITAAFGFDFKASQEIAVSPNVIGPGTALASCVMRSRQQPL